MPSPIVDNLIAVRIVHLLIQPFSKWDACKEGIIDEDGKELKKKADSDNWTMLHRLVWRLKLVLSKIPGGNTSAGTITAAYLLVKEHYENDKTEENISECTLSEYRTRSFKEYEFVCSILEEAPANVVGNVAGATGEPGDIPPAPKRRKRKDKGAFDAVATRT